MKGKIKKITGDSSSNNHGDYIYRLDQGCMPELDDVLEIPIYSKGSELLLAFPPVGVNILGDGLWVAKIRTDYIDVDIRGNNIDEITEKIDSFLEKIINFKKQLKQDLSRNIQKTIITILFESQDNTFNKNLLKIANDRTSKKFFEEFETKYNEKSKHIKQHQKDIQYKEFFIAIAWNVNINIKPNTKRKMRNNEYKKANELKIAIGKGISKPNIYDLINLSIKNPTTNENRKKELMKMSQRLLGIGWDRNFPTLEELLDGYMYALGNIDVKNQNEKTNCFPLNKAISSNYPDDGMDLKTYGTTKPDTRYDRHVFTLCENLLGDIPTSLSRIFGIVFNNGRSFDNSKKSFKLWKKQQ